MEGRASSKTEDMETSSTTTTKTLPDNFLRRCCGSTSSCDGLAAPVKGL